MNVFRKIYCRSVQFLFKCALPFLPYRNPEILSGAEEIARVLKEKNKKKPLVVTGKTVRKLPLFTALLSALEESGLRYEIFDGAVQNPTTENAEEARERYASGGCDCLIAFGGGSPIDCAKGAGALIARPDRTLQQMGGILKVGKKPPLFFALPTTAGSGSEATLACVLVDGATRRKYAISDFRLIPDYAVLDGGAIRSLPVSVAAATGMDALTHAFEAYLGRGGNRATRRDALQAAKLIFQNLVPFCTERREGQAEKLLYASHLAGRAFSKAYVGYVHAMAHPLGGKYNVPHGLANAVLLPVVLEEYGKAIHKKLKRIAVFCGLCNKSVTQTEASRITIAHIRKIGRELVLPERIPQLRREDLSELSALAEKEANPLYPVPVLWDKAKIVSVYEKILAE